MITPILEKLVVQGLASVNHKTLGQNGVCTIAVPENKSIVITKLTIQPFINPSFKAGFGNSNITNIEDSIQGLMGFNSTNEGLISNNFQSGGNILYEMLRRGTFQIELYSSDNNNTIFTFGTDFNFVNVYQSTTDPAVKPFTLLLPALSERSTDCFSVHRNNVHLRLRFLNSSIQQSGFLAPYKKYTVAVSSGEINNSIPETRQNVDINSPNLYFNTAAYSNTPFGFFGFYPFGIETNIENGGLKTFQGNNTITFPYYDDPTNVIGAGDGGEASFYSSNHANPAGENQLMTYMNAFIPYINVEYVLINEKADGQTLVDAKRYNSVIINK